MHGRALAVPSVLLGFAAALAAGGISAASGPTTQTFAYSGAMETFTVPADVSSITVTLDGAAGGAGCLDSAGNPNPAAPGGKGAHVVATLAVTPGQVYEVRAGGQGGGFGHNGRIGCGRQQGFNGGGGISDFINCPCVAGGGGGMSDIRPAGGAPLLVAGGGGGGGGQGTTNSGPAVAGAAGVGGDSGSPGIGGADYDANRTGGHPGGAGTQIAGGGGGSAGTDTIDPNAPNGNGTAGQPGSALHGGDTSTGSWTGGSGGGGGGGWFGGGGAGSGGGGDYSLSRGGGGGGGGGGSSHTAPEATSVSITQGQRTGDGQVVIAYQPAPAATTTQEPATTATQEPAATTTTELPTTTTAPPPADDTPPITAPGQVLLCPGRQVVLIDVHRSGRFEVVRGLALSSLAGKRVTIAADHGGGSASSKVAADGSFAARLPRPRSPQTNYTASHGTSRSSPLKTSRHLTVVSQRRTAAGLRIVARHSRGARVAGQTATLVRQTGCNAQARFATGRFDRRGTVTFLLPFPTPPDTIAVYRVTARTNRTFTLPIVVRAAR